MSTPAKSPAKLALEDGTIFTGTAFGAIGAGAAHAGEVVFNTSLSGYQEILTDPSYNGQIVTMTYPQIGNYGIAGLEDYESAKPQVEGLIIKELSPIDSNFRSVETLHAYLARYNIPGIAGIDTRALVRKLRIQGALKGIICTDPELVKDDAELVRRANAWSGLVGIDLVKLVSPEKPYTWDQDKAGWAQLTDHPHGAATCHVVAVDCGAKRNILRNLTQSGCRVTVVPAETTAEQILALKPDGVFISNGPGDPEPIHYVQTALQGLIGKKPIFGICLGHQLLALAMGATTYKLKFGHRGGNQPVQNTQTGKVEITSQNHGFAVDPKTLEARGGQSTHINLNDRTLEGFRHKTEPVFAVQYHPEASPGPHDATYLFDCFAEMIKTGKSPTAEQMTEAQRPAECGMIFGILAGLLAATSQSFSYLGTRHYVQRRSEGASVQILILGHIWMALFSLFVLPFVWAGDWVPWSGIALPLLGTIVCYSLAQLALVAALKQAEASRVSPLMSSKLVLTGVLAAIFGQPVGAAAAFITPLQWFAVLLCLTAAIAINFTGGRMRVSAILAVACASAGFSLSDWCINLMLKVLLASPHIDRLHASLLIESLFYLIVGLLAIPLATRLGSKKPRDWIDSLPFATTWFVAMIFLFISFAAVGIMLGSILQCTRSFITILLGAAFMYRGHEHIEPRQTHGVMVRRFAAGLLMFAGITLYVIRDPGALTMNKGGQGKQGVSHESGTQSQR